MRHYLRIGLRPQEMRRGPFCYSEHDTETQRSLPASPNRTHSQKAARQADGSGELAGKIMSRIRKARILERACAVSEMSESTAEHRGHRAMALMCAAVCWRGDPTDSEGLLSVADEFLQYIEGDNSAMPRPDKLIKGQMPKGRR